ncbi:hypothetical protein N0V90_005973 [Kalmusia sp. IMI 367209]|nr:hypothetical protein N0V90_005973 [Kalmusia sp. IMI 367209]
MRISSLTIVAVLPSAFATKPILPQISNISKDILNSLSVVFDLPLKLSVFGKTLENVTTSPAPIPNTTHPDFGESILPTITYEDYLAGKGEQIDVLFIPGGGATKHPESLKEEIAFVKSVKWVLTTCTGATIAARSGHLDGRRATTNKQGWEWATLTGPKTHWISKARWVDDGCLWSSSGVFASVDMMYAWVSHVYGEDIADYLAKAAEYPRWIDPKKDPFAALWETHDVEPATI